MSEVWTSQSVDQARLPDDHSPLNPGVFGKPLLSLTKKGTSQDQDGKLLTNKGVGSIQKLGLPFLKPAALATEPDRLPSFLLVLGIGCRTGVPEKKRLGGDICRERGKRGRAHNYKT